MTNRYENPLCTRYASIEMQQIFSEDSKFSTWRRLWVALAESQHELGLPVSIEQINEMKSHIDDINYDLAAQFEIDTRHDVVAHIRAYGLQCPKARSIIHLGATSSYVVDNTDIIMQRNALHRIKKLLINLIAGIYRFADRYKSMPCLSYTHFQAAQPTTVGKRAALWIQDVLIDIEQLEAALKNVKFAGCRGATGTSASYLSLFDGDHQKVKILEQSIATKMGFDETYAVCNQIYPRKFDYYMLSVLSGIAQSAYKFSNDIRLLSHLKELEEPFEGTQVGSSAMAYKRNPMRCERIASLARFVIVEALNPAFTAGTQWLERSLDDSANRRITIPEAFLATDAILSLYINVISGLSIYPKMIEKNLKKELPFLVAESILAHCVKKGADRQFIHEHMRQHALEAEARIKCDNKENDFLDRLIDDPAIAITKDEIDILLQAEHFTGRSEEQTTEYLRDVAVIIQDNYKLLDADIQICV